MNRKSNNQNGNGLPWVNPVGGYGDMLMVSGVLKQVFDQDPLKQFNLVRRTRYLEIFERHESIAEVGFPGKDQEVLGVDYWSMEDLGAGNQRPYQILARAFGLATPVQETLYLPGSPESDPLLHNFLPWKKINIVISPASDSPRKEMAPVIWHRLVDLLLADGAFVMQVGLLREMRIKNTYSVRGLTNPRQLITLLKNCDLVVTMDNFIMHAAHLAGIPSVVMWGPTQHEVYGYSEQVHLQMKPNCELDQGQSCIVSRHNKGGKLYGTPCHLGDNHCMNQVTPETLYEACKNALHSKGAMR